MNTHKTESTAAYIDDQLLHAQEQAILAYDEAESQARYAVTDDDVLGHISAKLLKGSKSAVATPLRHGDKQSLWILLTTLQDAFDLAVKERMKAILENLDDGWR